ncbi:gem-associated protein 4-like [Acipenser oxyrinchus oxyrinchus]|uniref:Gem-associated protein 4-like n=1 Tax=Acipenser oxyrinchus oxyrinchus TaxID=40147 RepID=A0AAD8CVB3_ACIOX|nr:gem-associated protein 4-like [Acipenser oxyrinchus oxyrinchus]
MTASLDSASLGYKQVATMDLGPWISCEKIAVLHGGFLLAEKQYRPKELSSLSKSDWETIGQPIVRAVEEIGSPKNGASQDILADLQWKKKILAILWAKLLHPELDETGLNQDVDRRWKEDLFFSVENILPNINYTVLFELVKSMGASELFVEFLSALPEEAFLTELSKLADHVLGDTSTEDARFFLDVWWELLKYKEGGEQDPVVKAFAAQAAGYICKSSEEVSAQPSKRFKPDPDSPHPSCVVSLFLDGINKMKDHVRSLQLQCYALANALDTLYTVFLLDGCAELPIEVYLQKVSRVVEIRGCYCEETLDQCEVRRKISLAENVREAEREVAAAHKPSRFKPSVTLIQSLKVLKELIQAWGNKERGEYKLSAEGWNGYAVPRLKNCLPHAMKALEALPLWDSLSECDQQIVCELNQSLRALLEEIPLPSLETSSAGGPLLAPVAMAIIDHRLERHQEACCVFASNVSWVFSGDDWMDCLEKNADALRNPDLVLKLAGTLRTVCFSDVGPEGLPKMKKLKEILVDAFSELSLPHKNTVLAGILSSCGSKGLCATLPRTVTDSFGKELNLAFNCIIQSEAQHSLHNAVASIARVTLQNPEAVLQRACHLAVVNLGAHKLLAQILKSLPGLSSTGASSSETSLLADCLKEAAWGKLSSSKEEDQFLDFLDSLMEPCQRLGDEIQTRLLQPAEVTKAFVLPHLTDNTPSVGLCLQILHRALAQEPQEGEDDSEHWIMTCSPFPLIHSLCQLLDNCPRCWQDPADNTIRVPLEVKDLLSDTLSAVCDVVGRVVTASPSVWSRSLFWLYNKAGTLDWTVRIRLKRVWGDHFKNEVPLSMLPVCDLSEHDWTGLSLPEYGPGTGLLAWMECCCLSSPMRDHMLDSLVVNVKSAEEVNMFSKGFLVALIQLLPWCTTTEWKRLAHVTERLLRGGCLYVPYTLEYIDFMPLLNLRPFTCDLQLSMLLLRAFQLLCSSSCSHWLPHEGWVHVGRLYAGSIRGILDSLKGKLPPSRSSKDREDRSPEETASEAPDADTSQEVVFVLMQLFCHLLHVLVMMPADTGEPLYLASLETLSQYEAVQKDHGASLSSLGRANAKHFLQSIAENLPNEEQRSTVLQKITRL